jgi:ferredoxin
MGLEAELRQARELSVAGLADAIESECTRCGACSKAVETHLGDREERIASVFPAEVRQLGNAAEEARQLAGSRPAD